MPTTIETSNRTTKKIQYKWVFIEMLISSLIGLAASLVLSIDAVILAANPDAVFSCDINATVSCGTVAKAWQASLLGFPNAFLGLIAEPVVITIAVASLGGVKFPRWFMLSAQTVYFIGLAFAYWLFTQSYFVIGAFCPWCLLVTLTTTFVFFSMLRVNILDNNFKLSPKVYEKVSYWVHMGADIAIMVLLLAVIVAMIIFKYA